MERFDCIDVFGGLKGFELINIVNKPNHSPF